jgi:hypothetical protein
MKTRFLLSHDERLACGSAISALLAVRAVFERCALVCTGEGCARVIVIYSRAADESKSIRQSESG